jgi:transcriptional regulator GlxA family with amidase domain
MCQRVARWQHSRACSGDAATLIVAGGEGIDTASVDAVLVDWVRERTKRARRTASICTGAFLLGACGVLDGPYTDFRNLSRWWK